MKQQVFKYLKSYSTSPIDVDRLIVSAFLKINRIQVVKNSFIKSLTITSENIDEYEKLINFILVIKSEIPKFDLEALIELFEFVISPSDRIINGAIYTPKYIREYITNRAFYTSKSNINNIKIADISCGCGGFLLTAARKLKKITKLSYKSIFENNIYGLDIQKYSTTRTRILLSVISKIFLGKLIFVNFFSAFFLLNLYSYKSKPFFNFLKVNSHKHMFHIVDLFFGLIFKLLL